MDTTDTSETAGIAHRTGAAPAAARPPGHCHGHAHGPAHPVSAHLRKVIAAILVPFAAAVAMGLLALWPNGTPAHPHPGVGFDQQTRSAQVLRVNDARCSNGPISTATSGVCQHAVVQLASGKDAGHTFTEIVQPGQPRRYTAGQRVVVAYAPGAPANLRYSVIDVERTVPMAALAAVFALTVVAVGRLRGVTALVALVISFAVLTLFMLPAILQGENPLLVAVVGASAIMLVALYLCHGVGARTSVAVLGTLCSLLLIGLLGSVFTDWALLTGDTSDETGLVHTLYPGIEIRGLLLAGVIIGSLGVLDDVTVTQVAAVWELKEADPAASWRRLYGAGMRIGRDHIASVVNTLVMAYAGASLPLLLLFTIARSGVVTVANSEVVAEEIVRTLVGSIGLVASVPLTTVLAALVVCADRPQRTHRRGRRRRV
ncbi:YibE/F family protein [Streptantibioticus rubrisoli]|uniref:YibE/F family protein n=1 Tax=Streptantibioticus rubrisoli TaxID=1387313 RepID=UPI003555DC0F